MDDLDDNINGMYDSAMQRIVLNANNESALYKTVFHEGVGEVLQAYNAKGAQKVRSVLLQYVADTKGKKYVQNIAQKYQNAYTPVEATKSYSDAVGEAMNDAISGIFSTKEGIHDFEQWMEKKEGAKKTQNVLEKLADHSKDVAESMRNLLNSGKLSKPAEDVASMAEKRASKVRKMILDELDTAIENAKSSAAYSLTNKDDYAIFLYQNNDEQKRYERLRDTSIKIENANDENYSQLTKGQLSSIVNARSLKEIENIFKNYCRKIKIWGTQFRSPELDFEYGFSVGALHESVHKQSLIKTDSEENNKFLALAKAIASANSITSNTKLLEMHTDQDYAKSIEPNHKVNSNIKYTYELISGYIDGKNIVPVKITVKEYLDRANTPNMMYVLESLPAINKDSITMKAIPDMNQGRRDTPLSDNYSLADILSVIKNNADDDERLDKAVGRYISD